MFVDPRGRALKRKTMKNLIIFGSVNAEEPWLPLKREQVPEWVQDADVMARMVGGEEVNNGETRIWYRAVPAKDNETDKDLS